MGRYLRLLEEAAEKRKRDKYAISPNKYAVSPDEDTIVPDLPRLSRNRVTASADYEKKKKDNDIKEEEYYTSIIDGKCVVEAEGGAEKYA